MVFSTSIIFVHRMEPLYHILLEHKYKNINCTTTVRNEHVSENDKENEGGYMDEGHSEVKERDERWIESFECCRGDIEIVG